MNLKYIILLVIFLAVSAYVGISIYAATKLTIPNPSPVTYNPKLIGDKVADVVFRSKDNAQLAGWFFRGTNDKAIILIHGAGNQNRVNEVYGGPAIAKHFYDLGYTVLMFDLRGSGDSEKTRISFGQYEANDVAGAFNYMVTQEFKPESIGILSDSLGAIATAMASSDIKEAGGIVLDSPAQEVRSVVSGIMKNEENVPEFLHPGVFFAAKLLFQIDIDSVRPIDRISELSETPLLFLHGEKDALIPPSHSEQLANKVKNAQRIVFPNMAHVEASTKDQANFLKIVTDFFEINLK